MSGTSADGIDAALVGFDPSPRVLAALTMPWPEPVRRRIRAVNLGSPLAEIAALDHIVAEHFARAALAVIEQAPAGLPAPQAIGSHGQTVWHAPNEQPPFTLQLGDPNLIAERTSICTVADFRRRDVAAGGQGAPLVPGFHAAVFRSAEEDRGVLNLGGIANLTLLPRDPSAEVLGFDSGPANTLLDCWIQQVRGDSCDVDGRWAASRRPDPDLLDLLLKDDYFAQPPPKSTGREHFDLGWLQAVLSGFPGIAPATVQATLIELTALSVARAVEAWTPGVRRLFACGGGVHNSALMAALGRALGARDLQTTAALGIDPDYVEAAAFAWLARRTLAGEPGNLRSVTGARREVVLGGIYRA